MAKRLVALVAVAAPVLAIGGVAFAQLASHSAVTAVASTYVGSAVSHDLSALRADSLALDLPRPADLSPAPQNIADVSVVAQPQAFKLALLDTVAQTNDTSGTTDATNASDQVEAQALAKKINEALAALPQGATQDQINEAVANAVMGVTNPVVLTAALAVVQKNDNSPAVTAAVAIVKSSPAIAPILSAMTVNQQNAALTITNVVAPTVSTVAIAFNNGTTGTTSGGAVITTSGPAISGLSGTSSGYTGA